LRCINGLETPTKGEILLKGKIFSCPSTDLNKVRLKMGMVFQSFNLFSHLMIIENVMLGATELLGRSRQEAYDNGMKLLRQVGMGEKSL